VITVKDFMKEGKICCKKTPTEQKSDVMFCILCQGQWKVITIFVQAKLLAKVTNKKMKSSSGGECAPRKKAKSSNCQSFVSCAELLHFTHSCTSLQKWRRLKQIYLVCFDGGAFLWKFSEVHQGTMHAAD
jgi:hypothetical protein